MPTAAVPEFYSSEIVQQPGNAVRTSDWSSSIDGASRRFHGTAEISNPLAPHLPHRMGPDGLTPFPAVSALQTFDFRRIQKKVRRSH
jgi:hypothetical protein